MSLNDVFSSGWSECCITPLVSNNLPRPGSVLVQCPTAAHGIGFVTSLLLLLVVVVVVGLLLLLL